MARTTRAHHSDGRPATASECSVAQQGTRPLYTCNGCGQFVTWLESKRTGRAYLVNVKRGAASLYYMSNDFHRCEPASTVAGPAEIDAVAS